jgi:SAM-dependent methyltransferase
MSLARRIGRATRRIGARLLVAAGVEEAAPVISVGLDDHTEFYGQLLVRGSIMSHKVAVDVHVETRSGRPFSVSLSEPTRAGGLRNASRQTFEAFSLDRRPYDDEDELSLRVVLVDGAERHLSWTELKGDTAPPSLEGKLDVLLAALPLGYRVLDVGARARSGISRRDRFSGASYVGLDILAGPNVDVVGDAHALSHLFPANHFDVVYSFATFEHLRAPWKVAVEINRVLKPGGIVFTYSHQMLAIHDPPFDFWRFSDEAWRCLFTEEAGFEILETLMTDPCYQVPRYRHWFPFYTTSLGFGGSSMIAIKRRETTLDWKASIESSYVPGEYQ